MAQSCHMTGHVLPSRLGVSCGAVRAVAQQEGAARPSSPVPGAHSRAEAALTGPQQRCAETGGVGQALRGRCRGKCWRRERKHSREAIRGLNRRLKNLTVGGCEVFTDS